MSLIVDNIFPIPVATLEVDKTIIDNTISLVNKFIKDNNLGKSSGQLDTTYYSDKDVNFLGKLGDIALLNVINNSAREFMHLLGFADDCYIEITSWLQLNTPNSYFHRHEHYGALVSGVVYLQTPEGCGGIDFCNPIEVRKQGSHFFHQIKNKTTPFNSEYEWYEAKKGKMILFESWLQHSVERNKSNDNRIAVAFNIWGTKTDVKR